MDTWLLIIIIAAGVILLGVGVFFLIRFLIKRHKMRVRKIDMIAPTELGTCHIFGTTSDFQISFGSIDVGFLVHDGVIVGHRPNSSSSFVMYPILDKTKHENKATAAS